MTRVSAQDAYPEPKSRFKKKCNMRHNCVHAYLKRYFYKHAMFVTSHPLPFVVIPIIVTAIFVPGMLKFLPIHEKDITYLYTPISGTFDNDVKIINEKWPLKDARDVPPGEGVAWGRLSQPSTRQTWIILSGKDPHANVLDTGIVGELQRLNYFVLRNINVFYKGHKYGYSELCMQGVLGQCVTNALVQAVAQQKEVEALASGWGGDISSIQRNITYPSMINMGSKIYNDGILNGVELYEGTNVVKSAKAWFMLYQLRFEGSRTNYDDSRSVSYDHVGRLWEDEFVRALKSYPERYLNVSKIAYYTSQTLDDGADENVLKAVPLVSICVIVMTFLVLVLGTVIVMPSSGVPYPLCFPVIDWVQSSHLVSMLGLLTPGMGAVCALGLLVYQSYLPGAIPVAGIAIIMPFLNLAIGVDNFFLMNEAWRRNKHIEDAKVRVATALSDCGVSITITASTDSLSFAIGCLSVFPSVYSFCSCTALAIVITYIFQLTFLVALFYLTGKLEHAGRHNVSFEKCVPYDRADVVDIVTQFTRIGQPGYIDRSETSFTEILFGSVYGSVLMRDSCRFATMIGMAAYLGLGIYGLTNYRLGLEPRRILVEGSYAQKAYISALEHLWGDVVTLHVVVNNPPDLSQPAGFEAARKIVNAFEDLPSMAGREHTQFWLDEYLDFASSLDFEINGRNLSDARVDYEMLDAFLAEPQNWAWRFDIVRKNKTGLITGYRFIVAMSQFNTIARIRSARVNVLDLIASPMYAEYNISTYHLLWGFADQFDAVLENTVQNMLLATLIMILVSLLLIPHPICSLWVGVSIVSIDIGVVGFGTLWGLNIDIITMVNIILSIGLSVDFTAHITYHFVASNKLSPKERVQESLAHVGWPILQGGASTLLGLSVLQTKSYIIQAFFRTTFLVIVIGLVHGLAFIPVLLSFDITNCCRKQRPHEDSAKERRGVDEGLQNG